MTLTPADIAARLSEYFATRRPRVTHEALLQVDIDQALALAIPPPHRSRREHRLGPKERPDFFVDVEGEPGIAVEVKVQGGTADVIRQLWRYTKHDAVLGVLLVTTRARHRRMPPTLDEKPIAVLYLGDFLL